MTMILAVRTAIFPMFVFKAFPFCMKKKTIGNRNEKVNQSKPTN